MFKFPIRMCVVIALTILAATNATPAAIGQSILRAIEPGVTDSHFLLDQKPFGPIKQQAKTNAGWSWYQFQPNNEYLVEVTVVGKKIKSIDFVPNGVVQPDTLSTKWNLGRLIHASALPVGADIGPPVSRLGEFVRTTSGAIMFLKPETDGKANPKYAVARVRFFDNNALDTGNKKTSADEIVKFKQVLPGISKDSELLNDSTWGRPLERELVTPALSMWKYKIDAFNVDVAVWNGIVQSIDINLNKGASIEAAEKLFGMQNGKLVDVLPIEALSSKLIGEKLQRIKYDDKRVILFVDQSTTRPLVKFIRLFGPDHPGRIIQINANYEKTISAQIQDIVPTDLKSIEVVDCWIKHDTHHSPWWEKGTQWEGKPAFTVYSKILTRNLADEAIFVDVSFRNEDGKLVQWAEGAPPHCQGNDGACRPTWSDKLKDNKTDYQAFRIPVPYTALKLTDDGSRKVILSVRAYSSGISSRHEIHALIPRGEPIEDQLLIGFGELLECKSVFVTSGANYDRQQFRSVDRPPLHEESLRLRIKQELFATGDMPNGTKVTFQLGISSYRATRPFVENYDLERQHYLPLGIVKSEQEEASQYGRPNQDYVTTTANVEKTDRNSAKRIATGEFTFQSIKQLLNAGNGTPQRLVLTVHIALDSRSIYRQSQIQIPKEFLKGLDDAEAMADWVSLLDRQDLPVGFKQLLMNFVNALEMQRDKDIRKLSVPSLAQKIKVAMPGTASRKLKLNIELTDYKRVSEDIVFAKMIVNCNAIPNELFASRKYTLAAKQIDGVWKFVDIKASIYAPGIHERR